MDPTTVIGGVFSGLNALLKITQQGAHFASVTHEVKQLQINVHLANDAINTAQRLLRQNIYLDDALRRDAERSIEYTETVLKLIRDTIEGCKHDIQIRGGVGIRNRTAWVLYRSQDFSAKLATLTNALHTLNRDIARMEAAKLPSFQLTPVHTGTKNEDHFLIAFDDRLGFSRSPTMRRRLARRSNQNLGSLSVSAPNLHAAGVYGQSLSATSSSLTLVDDFSAYVADLESGRHQESDSSPGLMHVMRAPSAIQREDASLLDVDFATTYRLSSPDEELSHDASGMKRSTTRRRSNLI